MFKLIMTFFANHLLLFLFITILLSTFIDCDSVRSPNSICPSFSCGDGLVLGYPFWQLDRKSDHCGYTDFGISCFGQTPMLQLSNHTYRVKNLNYAENNLLVAYGDVGDAICPVATHGVTLSTTSSFLNFTNDDKMAHFFYNCTLYPPSSENIKCLQLGAMHSYVFMEGSVPEFDWKGNCESIMAVPVMEKGSDGILTSTFGSALQEGFKLTWQPDHICQSCELSGGFCGYGVNTNKKFTTCFCNDGPHITSCRDRAEEGVSTRVNPNFLFIGATIFGFLVIVVMIFYVSLRKRDRNEKQGFSKIPTIGK